MDLTEIIKDSFKYPFNDKRQFGMILTVFILLGIILSAGFSSVSFNNGIFFTISLIVFFISMIYLSGYQIDIIRISCELEDFIPKFNPKKNIKDCLQLLVLSLIFSSIIGVIYLLYLFSIFLLNGEIIGFIVAMILYLILIIAVLIVSWIFVMSVCRLAHIGLNGSLAFKKSWKDLRKIGLANMFAYTILINIVVGIISVIALMISLSIFSLVENSFGLLISFTIFFAFNAYSFTLQSRAIGLLYTNSIYEI